MSGYLGSAPGAFKSLLYSELLQLQKNGRWRSELKDSVQKTSQDFISVALEYGSYLEAIETKLAPSSKFADAFPQHTTGHRCLRGLYNILMGSVDKSGNVRGGIIQKYGSVSPLGVMVEHLRKCGFSPLKHHLVIHTLRWVFSCFSLFGCTIFCSSLHRMFTLCCTRLLLALSCPVVTSPLSCRALVVVFFRCCGLPNHPVVTSSCRALFHTSLLLALNCPVVTCLCCAVPFCSFI